MNTSLAGSSMPCSRIQRRRARATSARSCSTARRLFFEGDLVTLKKPPHRSAAASDPLPAHRRNQFAQRQVRLLLDQTQQKVRVHFQRRFTPAPRFGRAAARFLKALHPDNRRARADLEVLRRLTSRSAAGDPPNHSLPHVSRVCFRHLPPPKSESIPINSLIQPPLGISPIQLERNML